MEPLLEGLEKTSYREGTHGSRCSARALRSRYSANEALNQARVEETGLRIPKLLASAQGG